MSNLAELLFDLLGLILELGFVSVLLELASTAGRADLALRGDAIRGDDIESLHAAVKGTITAIGDFEFPRFARENAVNENGPLSIHHHALAFEGKVAAGAVEGFARHTELSH
jgi:hypothetical protein